MVGSGILEMYDEEDRLGGRIATEKVHESECFIDVRFTRMV
jgi:hypothetical protein